jgi:hypothetical protein
MMPTAAKIPPNTAARIIQPANLFMLNLSLRPQA